MNIKTTIRNRLRKTTKLLLVSLVFIALLSCNGKPIYKDYQKIPDKIWNKNFQTEFEFEIEDTNQLTQVDILVRNASIYPYSNIWLFIHQTSPDGQTRTDTLECILADESGKWLGDGMGDIWDNEILWRKNYKFSQKGTYTYRIEHAMRTDMLPGVMDIGLSIKEQE